MVYQITNGLPNYQIPRVTKYQLPLLAACPLASLAVCAHDDCNLAFLAGDVHTASGYRGSRYDA